MPAPGKTTPTSQKRGGLTPEGGKRLSDLMKSFSEGNVAFGFLRR
jgi:hypothetical protein